MTSAHTVPEERMVPEFMFLSEHVPQLSITDWKVKWPLHFTFTYSMLSPLHSATNERSASPINPVTAKKYGQCVYSNYQLLT